MNQTFTLPASLVNDIDMLKRNWGLDDIEATIKHLLKLAVAREKKIFVAQLYQNRQKTLRQCAEILNVELEEMMDILIELGISFGQDDLPQQLETVNKLVKEMRAAKGRAGKIRATVSRRRRRLQKLCDRWQKESSDATAKSRLRFKGRELFVLGHNIKLN